MPSADVRATKPPSGLHGLFLRVVVVFLASFLDHVASNSRLSPIDKVNYLYMAGLARRPNSIELKGLQNSVTSANTLGQLQDIWWAILNSNEFILNH